MQFLTKIAKQLSEDRIWQTLFKSQVKNKAAKVQFVLQHFQTYGYYPYVFIK